MALAKAFPDTYQYELNEPTSVSATLVYLFKESTVFGVKQVSPWAGQLY